MKAFEIKGYYNSLASDYDGLYNDAISMAENRTISQKFNATLKEFDKNVSVLDLGCGTGLGYEFLKHHCNKDCKTYKYYGIDISTKMIDKAIEKWGKDQNAKFFAEEMSNLYLIEDSSIDVVTSFFGSFSHALEANLVLDQIKRVLKPNGKLFLMTYSRFSLREIINFLRGDKLALSSNKKYFIRNSNESFSCDAIFYSSKDIKILLKNNGFEVLKIRGLNISLEIALIKKFMNNKLSLSMAWLNLERCVLYFLPDLGHSLITVAKF